MNRIKAYLDMRLILCIVAVFCIPLSSFAFNLASVFEANNSVVQKYIIDPVATLWKPWFDPNTSISYVVKEKEVLKEEEKEETPALIVTSTPTPQYSKSEIMSWIKDAVKLQSTVVYQNTEGQVAGATTQAPIINNYYERIATSQGLADTVGRATGELQTNINSLSSTVSSLSSDLSTLSTTVTSSGAWSTNGTDVWRTSGSVGIGTTSPNATLMISRSTSGADNSDQFTIENYSQSAFPFAGLNTNVNNANGGGYLNFRVNGTTQANIVYYGTTNGSAGLEIANSQNSPIYLKTSGTERMRIAGDGTVGIGTTSPSAKLSLTGSGTGTGRAFAISDSAGADKFVVHDVGRTGIGGAPDATAMLKVIGNAWIPGTGKLILGTPSAAPSAAYQTIGGDTSGNDLTFRTYRDFFFETDSGDGTAGTNRLTIKGSTGLVGIGTTTPGNTLSVAGNTMIGANGSSSYRLNFSNTTGTQYIYNRTYGGSNGLVVSAGGADTFYFNQDGTFQTTGAIYAGSGLTSGVNGTITATGANSNVNINRDTSAGLARVVFQTGGTGKWGMGLRPSETGWSLYDDAAAAYRLYVSDTNGAVGISSTTPWALLSVNPTALGSGVPEFVVGSSTATHFIVNGGGNVGVGTTNPTGALTISSSQTQSLQNGFSNLKLEYGVISPGNNVGGGAQISFSQGWWSGSPLQERIGAIRGFKTALEGEKGGGVQLLYAPYGGNTDMLPGLTLTGLGQTTTGPVIGIGTSTPTGRISVDGGYTRGNPAGLQGLALQVYPGNYGVDGVSGTLTNAVANSLGVLTLSSWSSAVTYTNASTLYVAGAPAAGSNVTITNPFALYVNGGTSYFGGNVGIGTTTPLSRLDVLGGVAASPASSGVIPNGIFKIRPSNGGSSLEMGVDTLGAAWLQVHEVTNLATNYNLLLNPNGGKVGVGTSTPRHALSVVKDDPAVANNSPVYFPDGSWAAEILNVDDATSQNGLLVANRWEVNTATPFLVGGMWDNSNGFDTWLKVDGVGNTGIGTTSPSAKLSVKGGGTTTGRAFAISDSSDAEKFTVLDSGNVGIGSTSPTHKLDVGGDAQINEGIFGTLGFGPGYAGFKYQTMSALAYAFMQDNAGQTYVNAASGAPIFFKIDNATKMIVSSAGNIGIATSSPWRTLSVNGTVAVPGLVNDSTGYYACVNTTTGQLSTSTTVCGASSIKFKENVQDLAYGLNEIIKLRPVSFDYKDSYIKDGRRQVGFIAEEVEPIIPEVVAYDNNGEVQGLDYPKFVAVIVRAIKDMAHKFFSEEVKTNKLCVGETCIDEAGLKTLLENQNVVNVISSVPETSPSQGEVESEAPGGVVSEETATATTTLEVITEIPGETATSTPE